MQEVEIWKPINMPEFAGKYEVSSNGRIRSLPRTKVGRRGIVHSVFERVLKPTKLKNGYETVTLSNKPINKTFLTHVLVAMHFVDNPLNLGFVNHGNGIKSDNHYKNLSWCTRSENMLHAFSTGLIPKKRNRKRPKVETLDRTNCL